MTLRPRLCALALLAPLACLAPYGGDTTASPTSTTSTSTTSLPNDPTSSSAPDPTSFDPTCGFICPTDHPPDECDVWDDDCPAGEKCTLVSLDGDNAWESKACVPVAPAPGALYEPCTVLGNGSDGLDTCNRHLICLPGPSPDERVCIGFCTGSSAEPSCVDPAAACIETAPPWGFCLPQCDPLTQDCPEGDLCAPTGSAGFVCTLDDNGGDGQLFGACDYLDDCAAALYCADPAAAVECDANESGCCLPLCDLDEPDDCPGAGQECLAWYTDPADAAPFNTDVGACTLP